MASAALGEGCGKCEGCGDLIRKRVEKKMEHFTETLDRLLRILGFINTRCGKVLLIGVGGRGKSRRLWLRGFRRSPTSSRSLWGRNPRRTSSAGWRSSSLEDGVSGVAKHFLEEESALIQEALLSNIVPNTILEEESGPRIRTQLPHQPR
jgi:hypothetical protein